MKEKLQNYVDNHNPSVLRNYCHSLFQKSELDMASVYEEAHKLTLQDAERKRSHYKRRNFMAENMYGNMVGLLIDNYPELIDLDSEKRPFIKLSDNVRIYPKKLDEKYLPNNIVTKHVLRLRGQKLITGGTKIHVLNAGFVLDGKEWMKQPKGYFVSYTNEYYPTKTEWVLDLNEYRKSKAIILPYDVQQPIEENLATAKIVQSRKAKE